MDDLKLKKATAADSEFAYRVKRAAFREYVERVWGEWDGVEQRGRHEGRFAAQDFRVIEVADTDVGILATKRWPDCLKLNQLFILPEHQGLGIGTACVKLLIDEACGTGLPIRLQVLEVNPRAIEFYRRLGFVVNGRTATHVQMER